MKKQLLNEGEIRKFMKFANIGTLTDGFVGKINESAALEEDTLEEDTLEEAMPTYEDEHEGDPDGVKEEIGEVGTPMEQEEEPEMDAMDDDPEMDAEAEMDDEEVEVDVDMDEVDALEQAIAVLQQVVDAAKGGADMDDEPMDDMDAEPEMGDMPDEESEELEEVFDALEEDEGLNEEDVIEEVTRRVAKRLLAARK
tara:strand:- start:5721 stop:6311 length:591 start_codon:yes stop_codon:yes gene_type:complete